MSEFDDIDFDRPPDSGASASIDRWDIFSIITLVLTACLAGYFLLVFIRPETPLNPLSRQNADRKLPATATATLIQLEPTWTPSATPYIPPTQTARPTFTPVYTPTLFSLIPPTKTPVPTKTPAATKTPKAQFTATVEYISSAKYYPELGCNWQGVAGIVLNQNGAHIQYQEVHLNGIWNGESVNFTTVAGIFIIYGPSGWELNLGTTPINTKGTLFLQLMAQGSVPLSDNIYINTYADCSKNMVYVTFKANR